MRTAISETVVAPSATAGYVVLIAGAAALDGFLFGFDTVVINGAVLALKSEFNATTLGIGLSVSLALLICDRRVLRGDAADRSLYRTRFRSRSVCRAEGAALMQR
jgi:hypothetical protein